MNLEIHKKAFINFLKLIGLCLLVLFGAVSLSFGIAYLVQNYSMLLFIVLVSVILGLMYWVSYLEAKSKRKNYEYQDIEFP